MAVQRDTSSPLGFDQLHISKDEVFKFESDLTVRISQSDICQTTASAVATGEHINLNGAGDVSHCLQQKCPGDYMKARDQLIKKTKSFKVGELYSCTARICGPSDEGVYFDKVYHAIVPPAFRGPNRQLPPNWTQVMKELYTKLFREADKDGKASLALPLLGSGKAGATFDEAIEPLACALQELQLSRARMRVLRDITIHVLHSEAFKKLVSRISRDCVRQMWLAPSASPQLQAHPDNRNQPQPAGVYDAPQDGQVSCYLHARRQSEDEAYKMESKLRGMAIIIDIENFHNPHQLPDRPETQEDLKKIMELFQGCLGFEVQVFRNCTAEEIKTTLQNFANQEKLIDVDSCAVIVMSHGTQGDIIFGADGFYENNRPKEGTFIYATEIQSFFTSSKCPALRDKPKLFIIQACRGDMEDTIGGPRPVRIARDASLEDPTDVHHSPEAADMFCLFATVENFVSYRGVFIQLLCRIFQQFAHVKHIRDMATLLHREMSRQVIAGHILTMSQDKGTLLKDWYLNPPPPTSAPGQQ